MIRPIDQEEFEQWKSSPIGEFFFAMLAKEADRAKEAWVSASWDGERPDPTLLACLKERADLANQLSDITASELQAILEENDAE